MAYPQYPETKEEWWQMVDENWADLFLIMQRFIPIEGHETIDGDLIEHPLSVEVTRIKENKDIKLVRYFQATWMAAPDKSWIHEIPKWMLLCDLCSEEYVLHDSP